MARSFLTIAVGLALLSLTVGIVARARHTGSNAARKRLNAGLLLPIAILVGTIPQLMRGASHGTRIAASIASLALTATAFRALRRPS